MVRSQRLVLATFLSIPLHCACVACAGVQRRHRLNLLVLRAGTVPDPPPPPSFVPITVCSCRVCCSSDDGSARIWSVKQSGDAITATNTVLEHATLGAPGDVCVTALDWDVRGCSTDALPSAAVHVSCLCNLHGHVLSGCVWAITVFLCFASAAWQVHGTRLATGSKGGVVRVWSMPEGAQLAAHARIHSVFPYHITPHHSTP
jgi:WD40 repeat protein